MELKHSKPLKINKIGMKRIFILIIYSLIIMSCEKEKIVEVEKEYNWKSHEAFRYDDIVQMNSFASNDNLFFLGQNSFSSMVSDSLNNSDVLFGGSVSHYSIWSEQPSDMKLPICKDYFFLYNKSNGWIGFIPTLNPVTFNTQKEFSIKNIDSTYSYFDFQQFNSGECVAINNQNQSLIPYVSFFDSKYILKLALIDINVESRSSIYLDTLKTKILSITDDYQSNLVHLESIASYFFLTTNSKVYRIDNMGTMVNVLDKRINRIIESLGKLYGFGSGVIFTSSNDGLTWEEGYAVQSEYSYINYSKIDDKIIAYRYSQIWEISISETEINARELDNDGLDGKSITSVSKFDNKVYLTTLSGVYYKSFDNFFDDRIKSE